MGVPFPHRAHRGDHVLHVGVERETSFRQHLDRRRGGQSVAPHQDRFRCRSLQRLELFFLVRQPLGGACAHDADDAVDDRRRGDRPREAGITDRTDRLRGAVDRVLRSAVGRQEGIENSARCSVERWNLETGRHAGVRQPGAAATRARADADAGSLRQSPLPAQKAVGDVDHLLDLGPFDDAVALRDGLERAVGARQRRRVRGGSPRARIGLADLVDDQRLAGSQCLFRDAQERLGCLDVFDHHQEGVGLAFIEQVLDDFEALEAGFVARRDDVVEGHLLRPAAVEERESHAAGLRDERDAPVRAVCRQQRDGRRGRRRAEMSAAVPSRCWQSPLSSGP